MKRKEPELSSSCGELTLRGQRWSWGQPGQTTVRCSVEEERAWGRNPGRTPQSTLVTSEVGDPAARLPVEIRCPQLVPLAELSLLDRHLRLETGEDSTHCWEERGLLSSAGQGQGL